VDDQIKNAHTGQQNIKAMAISITGVTPTVQAVPVTAVQPKTAQADSQAPESMALKPSVQGLAMQSKDSPTARAPKPRENQQKKDIVELSPEAKAKMLSEQGRPIIEIAVILNLDAETVASYLGATPVTTRVSQKALQDNHSPPASQQPSGQAEVFSGNSSEKQQGTLPAQNVKK
jgi:hypothetical protein